MEKRPTSSSSSSSVSSSRFLRLEKVDTREHPLLPLAQTPFPSSLPRPRLHLRRAINPLPRELPTLPTPAAVSSSSSSYYLIIRVSSRSNVRFRLSSIPFFRLPSSLSFSSSRGRLSLSSSAIPSSKRLGYGTTLAFFGRELDELSRRKSGHANCSPKRERRRRRRRGGGGGLGRALGGNNSRRVVTTR